MNTKSAKLFVIVLFALPLLLVGWRSTPIGAKASQRDDTAGIYKTKCSACHGATAAKWFDVALSDEELVTAILKGKKGAKPPYMPEFETKGINEDSAKALVVHMRGLRAPTD